MGLWTVPGSGPAPPRAAQGKWMRLGSVLLVESPQSLCAPVGSGQEPQARSGFVSLPAERVLPTEYGSRCLRPSLHPALSGHEEDQEAARPGIG